MGKNLYGGGIRDDHIICLECDKMLQLLSNRHLARHGLTPDTYRQKWGISPHIPLTSHRLAQRRYLLANTIEKHGQNQSGEDDYPRKFLHEAEADLDDFFHELAEALTIIQGQAHLAQEYLSAYMQPQEYLEAIQHTVMRIGQRMQGDFQAR